MENQAPILKLQLPHPYLTRYHVEESTALDRLEQFQVLKDLDKAGTPGEDRHDPGPLHNSDLYFSALEEPEPSQTPPLSNNTPWGRARRTTISRIAWKKSTEPTLGQIWLLVYAILTQRPELEYFRVSLKGSGSDRVKQHLKASSLAVDHPSHDNPQSKEAKLGQDELLILRGVFWQGAASPIGCRSAWTPGPDASYREITDGTSTLGFTITTKFPSTRVHAWHPRRPQKPVPGSIIYSRYIPHLDENYSMIALDYQNQEHLKLFHKWQNDPRVAKGWNETGTLDQHRQYLKNLHEDPHTITVLAQFEGISFAYFEIYWAKEDHLGAYYDASDFDRGRHSLVGDERFRGKHRVTAWWSSLMHFLFLDDPRTMFVVGEPKATNTSVLAYDFMHGFSFEKFVDLPHKRSALVKCSREKFFQLCPLDHRGGVIAGTSIPIPSKL